MTDEEKKKIAKRRRTIAVIIGVALGLICHALPPEYRGPCETLAQLCRGGF